MQEAILERIVIQISNESSAKRLEFLKKLHFSIISPFYYLSTSANYHPWPTSCLFSIPTVVKFTLISLGSIVII